MEEHWTEDWVEREVAWQLETIAEVAVDGQRVAVVEIIVERRGELKVARQLECHSDAKAEIAAEVCFHIERTYLC